MPWKGLFRSIALVPLLTPSMLSAMALIQLFGQQGYLRDLMAGESIYGPIGIVIGLSFAHFPHLFVILSAGRQHRPTRGCTRRRTRCARGRLRVFRSVTLPSIKYGLVSSAIVSFTLCMTDFGVPKVIGGQYDVLATEIYKQVVGRQNFQMGAVVSIVLLVPALVAFVIDRRARRRAAAMLTSKAVPMQPTRVRSSIRWRSSIARRIALFLLAMVVVPGYTSLTKVLAVQPRALVPQLRVQPLRRRRLAELFQQPADGAGDVDRRHRDDLRRRVPRREIARSALAALGLPDDGDDADGDPRAGPRAVVHLLPQRSQQPARDPVRHADGAGHLDDRPLLHGEPPDRGDGAAPARRRVRGGLRFAEGVAAADVLRVTVPICLPRSSTSSSTCS
jgi:ABC-type molybdate transport system permease subunit